MVEPPPVVPIPPARTCVLDDAPDNSRIVVLQYPGLPSYIEYMTPQGARTVPVGDYARTLPLGADVHRVGSNTYVAIQRDSGTDIPPLICTSAVECIRQFPRHFHGARE